MDTKVCTKCGKELPLTEYYSRGNGRLRSECKTCHNQYVKLKYRERKDIVDEVKKGYCCKKYGESRYYMLDFHHKDRSTKTETVARMTSNHNKMEDIQKEIDKCIILCSNCHREFHYLESKENITIEQYLNKR